MPGNEAVCEHSYIFNEQTSQTCETKRVQPYPGTRVGRVMCSLQDVRKVMGTQVKTKASRP